MTPLGVPPDTRPAFDLASIRGVLFDAYGTLFEFGNAQFRAAIGTILAEQGIETDFERFHRSWIEAYSPSGVWGTESPNRQDPYRDHSLNGPLPAWHSQWEIWRRQFASALEQHGLEGDPDRAADVLRDQLGEADPFPEAHDTVERLDAHGLTLGLLSNADEDFLQRALSRARLRFSVIQSSESLRAYKPHRAVFLAACERLGCAPNETLYVGDSPIADVGGAHNAGLRTVWIRRPSEATPAAANAAPNGTANEAANGPPQVVDTYADMMKRLPQPDLTVATLLGIVDALP
ncbi:MAG: HAD-IA family hydrolase [Chloroflexi bacterium]|nr:HAD-IA family hydrolase [Chloroflexota bacterium]MDA1148318.1 HAD-IA family hydrolase [Chloroflexota bacterium]